MTDVDKALVALNAAVTKAVDEAYAKGLAAGKAEAMQAISNALGVQSPKKRGRKPREK